MRIIELGITPYEEALKVQTEVLEKRISGDAEDTLILVEHSPVVTLGRLDGESNISDKRYFEDCGIPVFRSGRGGKTTFHAPGQLVLYPIIDLEKRKKDIAFYIDFLEKTVACSLKVLGVGAYRKKGVRGVWADFKKIAFTGIAVKRWVTYHGVAVNINNDTEGFRHIHPCGDSTISVTSAKEVLARALDMDKVRSIFARQFQSDLEIEYSYATKAGAEVGA
jgi:lipoate-protein ligase B